MARNRRDTVGSRTLASLRPRRRSFLALSRPRAEVGVSRAKVSMGRRSRRCGRYATVGAYEACTHHEALCTDCGRAVSGRPRCPDCRPRRSGDSVGWFQDVVRDEVRPDSGWAFRSVSFCVQPSDLAHDQLGGRRDCRADQRGPRRHSCRAQRAPVVSRAGAAQDLGPVTQPDVGEWPAGLRQRNAAPGGRLISGTDVQRMGLWVHPLLRLRYRTGLGTLAELTHPLRLVRKPRLARCRAAADAELGHVHDAASRASEIELAPQK